MGRTFRSDISPLLAALAAEELLSRCLGAGPRGFRPQGFPDSWPRVERRHDNLPSVARCYVLFSNDVRKEKVMGEGPAGTALKGRSGICPSKDDSIANRHDLQRNVIVRTFYQTSCPAFGQGYLPECSRVPSVQACVSRRRTRGLHPGQP